MSEREKLLKWVFDNEFITKPSLKNEFSIMLNRVINEAKSEVSQPSTNSNDDFSLFSRLKDEPKTNDDDYGGSIKRFQD